MAIDDNTTYGLTGAQVKDLANKVNVAQSTLHVITADDCNWNRQTGEEGTPDIVAAWKLPSGLYEVRSLPVYLTTNYSTDYIQQGIILVQEGASGYGPAYTWYNGRNMNKLYMAQVTDSGSWSQGKKSVTFTAEQ